MIERVNAIAPVFERSIHQLANTPSVVDIRNYGLAGGITLAPYEETLRRRSKWLCRCGKRLLRSLWR